MSSTKTPRHSKLKLTGLFILICLWNPAAWAAPNTFIWLHTSHGQFKIPAVEKKDRISVDVLKLSESLGAGTRVSNGIYVMQFSSETIKVNPVTDIFSLKQFNNQQWTHVHLRDRSKVDDGRLYVTLESLPVLLNRSFTYHLQKRALSLGSGLKPTEVKGYKNIPIRYAFKDQKTWLSLEDLANALGVIIYSSRVGAYSLVLPDFTILELNIGQKTILKRRQAYKQLNDPVLAFAGSPYVTLPSINNIFEADVLWDSQSKTAMIPSEFGRLRDIQVAEVPRLAIIGYKPEPFNIKVDNFSAYYQEPIPTYSSANSQPYESVRDFLSNSPIDKKGNGLDKVSGQAVAEIKGSMLRTPFEARGSFEKVGSTGRLINGGLKYGFPIFLVEGGREYLTFSGLNSQFESVDQVSISHSNDHYNEGKVNPTWQAKALFGQMDFNVFSSTEFFSQTVLVEQQIGMGSIGSNWKLSPGTQWGVKLDHYQFYNRAKEIESVYNDQALIDFILGEGEPVEVDPADETALLETVVSDQHSTTILDLNYSNANLVELQGTVGLSHYKDELQNDESVYDSDWKVRSLLGGRKSRVEVSYENVGARYRSVGNTFSYQDKKITRVAPYLNLTRWWRMFAEGRKEQISVLESQGIPSYTTRYLTGTNIFSFKSQVVRWSVNNFDSTLSGKRLGSNLDLTQYIGSHSMDLGGGSSIQYDSFDQIYKRSYTGKASFQYVGPSWKFSLGEEYTRNIYPTVNYASRYESISNMLLEIKKFRTLLQYAIEPRYLTDLVYLYTGYVRMGYEVGDKKYLDLFFSSTSLEQGLGHPEVWRAGFEFSAQVF